MRCVVRRAEIIAALSIATDLAMGQPVEFALRSCLLALRLGETLGFTSDEMRETYYETLLRYIGCNAETYVVAALFGDEFELRRDLALIDRANIIERTSTIVRAAQRATEGTSVLALIPGIVKLLARARSTGISIITGHCEVAERIALRLGLGPVLSANLAQFFERWDGRGLPRGLNGEAIARSVRLATLAQDLILLSETYGPEHALAVIKKRRGRVYDPQFVNHILTHRTDVTSDLHKQPSWDAVLAAEPGPQTVLAEDELDEGCRVIADFSDIKAPFTIGHSRAVAALTDAAGRACGLPDADVATLRRAAYVHDLGDVSVPTALWIKPSAFTEREWERVRLHPYYTERILARPKTLAAIGHVASLHHERLNASGYHRGVGAPDLTPAARILAAAEAYQTKVEPRPHRPTLSADAAASALRQEMRAGCIDSEAGAAVLAAAGHRVPPVRRQLVADLTGRELDVLRLIARGQPTRDIAAALGISEKTAGNHVQNLYGKIAVSTRAGAVMFAVEHGLLNTVEDN
jgi:HD-GYP domain-containing protein (c-di-GMP phosphodiesterase class II)